MYCHIGKLYQTNRFYLKKRFKEKDKLKYNKKLFPVSLSTFC